MEDMIYTLKTAKRSGKELNACPFCGWENPSIRGKYIPSESGYINGFHVEYYSYYVQCNRCLSRSGEVGGHIIPNFELYHIAKMPMWATTNDVLRATAAEVWNKRTGEVN